LEGEVERAFEAFSTEFQVEKEALDGRGNLIGDLETQFKVATKVFCFLSLTYSLKVGQRELFSYHYLLLPIIIIDCYSRFLIIIIVYYS
jgi:hypothetical protein